MAFEKRVGKKSSVSGSGRKSPLRKTLTVLNRMSALSTQNGANSQFV